MASTRQLAAIMFTDIVGYSSLMGIDEEKAYSLLKLNRKIQRPLIEKYHGQWIKELGDGVLASFSTVTDAVICAGSMLQSCKEVPGLELRIGIHLGEIVFENNDIFGDGVNIASRIMPLAVPGGICITESVYNNIANKKGINARFLREETLKNIKDPVRIYDVSIEPSVIDENPHENSPHPKQVTVFETIGRSPGKSIAVLPFVNMSNDSEQEYFSDGITEEILNSLANVKDLRVAGRTSSFHFKGKNMDLRKIGQKLNVQTVLEGSVRKQGNQLRITAQLVNVEDGYHFWSERYDRAMDDIFAIQDEIALSITEKLKITLLEKEKAIIQKRPTEHTEAYDLYLKGRFYLNKRGAGIKKGLEYFQKAATIEPAVSLAYSGMADAYSILAFYGTIPPDIAIPKVKQNAEKAIQSDAANAEAFTALAFISTFYDWNWAEAKKRLQHVFGINPNYAPAHFWYSYYLSFVEGRHEEGIREARKAADVLEPLESISHHVLAVTFINAGKFEEALQEANMAIELDEHSFPGYRALGVSLAGLNRHDEAIEALKTCVMISARHPWSLSELSWVYSLMGNTPESQKISEELITRSQTEFISGMMLAGTSYFSKNFDKAFEFMELAFEQRDCTLPCIKAYPPCSFIRNDPRFRPFLDKMSFPG
jgi:adenylate cyclase